MESIGSMHGVRSGRWSRGPSVSASASAGAVVAVLAKSNAPIVVMRQSTRLVANSLIVLSQTGLSLFLGLFTSRLVVQALGPVDFGIFVTVGASTALLFVLATAFTLASSRHMGVAVGKGDERMVRTIFNSILLAYIAIAVVLLIVGALIAGPLVDLLTMPEERKASAFWVVITASLTIGLTCLVTPYNAITAAYQRQFEVAFVEIVSSVLRLSAAAVLLVLPTDLLVIWACAIAGTQLVQTVVTAYWVTRRIPAASIHPSLFSWTALREVIGFGGWSLLMVVSFQLQIQGAQIVINKIFGPIANSSFGLGAQLASYQQRIANVFNGSARPAIISNYGAGRMDVVRRLVLASGRFTTIAAAFIGVPILFETPMLLRLWLGSATVDELPYIVEIARIVTVWMLVKAIAVGFNFVESARGQIQIYAVVSLLIDTTGLITAAVIAIRTDWGLVAVPGTLAVFIGVNSLFRAVYASRRVGLGAGALFGRLLMPVIFAVGGAALAAWVIVAAIEPSIWRVPVTVAVSWVMLGTIGLVVATTEERGHFVRIVRQVARQTPVARRFVAANPATADIASSAPREGDEMP